VTSPPGLTPIHSLSFKIARSASNWTIVGLDQVRPPSRERLTATPPEGSTRLNTRLA
jgi:hypothetical protein